VDESAREQAFLNALVTEHFVLQSARGAITGESAGRAALYVGALSSALIALGFAIAKSVEVFYAIAAAALPLVIVLGAFTFIRLVEIGIEDVSHVQSMQRIRRFYTTLSPDGSSYFPDLMGQHLVLGLRLQSLLTVASAVGVINSMVVGVGVALIAGALGFAIGWDALIGVPVAIGLVVLHVWYQLWEWTHRLGAP
jgi:hypothetical protein